MHVVDSWVTTKSGIRAGPSREPWDLSQLSTLSGPSEPLDPRRFGAQRGTAVEKISSSICLEKDLSWVPLFFVVSLFPVGFLGASCTLLIILGGI